MAINSTSLNAALKQTYQLDSMVDLFFGKSAFYNKLKRDKSGGGEDNIVVPVDFGPAGASSYGFATAKNNAGVVENKTQKFQLNYLEYNHIINVTSNILRRAESKGPKAFVSALDKTLRDLMYRERRWMSVALFRDGWGTKGKIAAGTSVTGTTLTLDNIQDAKNFEIGDYLDVATTKGDANKTRGSSGNGLIVTRVNTQTGVLTFGFDVDDATNGIPTIAAGDWLYNQGDAVLNTRTAPEGLGSWLTNDPTALSTSFYGVVRDQYPERLAGLFVNGGGTSLIESFNNASATANTFSANLDVALVSNNTFAQLANSLEGKRMELNQHGKGEFGYRTMVVHTAAGPIEILPELCCPDDKVYMLDSSTWKMVTIGDEMFQIGDENGGDGLRFRLLEDANTYQLRHAFLGNVICDAPGKNVVITL